MPFLHSPVYVRGDISNNLEVQQEMIRLLVLRSATTLDDIFVCVCVCVCACVRVRVRVCLLVFLCTGCNCRPSDFPFQE